MKADEVRPEFPPMKQRGRIVEMSELEREGYRGAQVNTVATNRRYLRALRRAAGTDVLVILPDNTLARLTVDPAVACEGIPS